MDLFLQVNGSTKNHPLLLPDIVMPKLAAFGDRCLISEGPASARIRSPSMDIGKDSELPVITINNSADEDCYSGSLEVRRTKSGNRFLLRGKRNDENSVSLILKITDSESML